MTALAEAAIDVAVPPMVGRPQSFVPFADGVDFTVEGEAIGTRWRIVGVAGGDGASDARRCMANAIALVTAQMSQWNPDSLLSRFNRADPGTRFAMPPQFALVLDCALNIARATGGAFDPALGRVSEAWGFGAAPPPATMPAPAGDESRWRSILFDAQSDTIVQPGGVALDFSAIAKGYAVDLASILLCHAGVMHHLVEIGGELRGCGVRRDGQPWWAGIEDAPGIDAPPARVALSNWSLATSGDWHRRRSAGGGDWSHTFAPATGAPMRGGSRAASVLHRDCMQADALATAMMAMPPGDAMAFADARNLPARVTDAGGTIRYSAAWRAML
ncbi:FAD:protein FMN transferase [Croceicoccus sp. YJ47]|uniref:FAD:protein FMN transferase n=1 Tax=Croceicoccus sp. YJ47 TaxID=2798724 RepID=UPI0019225FB4|nr:FAD:protein FMN transferase [Croceicoccus sp. YJ47]QQN73389.1 FAD:protein FMN transferase [Croceicoccus sp. YJ47]